MIPERLIRQKLPLLPALAVALLCLWNGPAKADFRLCNNTSDRKSVV